MRAADAAQYMRVLMGQGTQSRGDPLVAPYVIVYELPASREYDAVIFVGLARTGKDYRPD